MRKVPGTIFTLFGTILTLGGAPASAQLSIPPTVTGVPSVLDVPYLPQSELLCGGAALAMVERWWGRRGVYAEDFAGLVRPEVGGIRTTELAAAAQARGWETLAFDGTPEAVQQYLAQGVPVVALIEVAPNRYHYVVLLGWSDKRVTFHDPARAPSRVIDEARFLREWDGADRWAMVLRPMAPSLQTAITGILDPPITDSMPCRPWLDRAIDAAAADQLDRASNLLNEAAVSCPSEPLVLRELAGVRFKQGRWAEARQLSDQYLARVPDDSFAWQLLAASRYLTDDRENALRAWNRIGRPAVDLVTIAGVRQVRFRSIADAMALPHGTVLTPARLALARRRVGDLPALRRSAVEYQPVEGGRVEVRAVVVERPVVGPAWRLLATGALGAIAQHTVGATIATPSGAGELWTGVWGWQRAHEQLAFRLDMPVRLGVSGVMRVGGSWERFRFSLDTAQRGVLQETRRSGNVVFGGWLIPALRPSIGIRFERWSGARRYLAATAGTELRAASDRFVFMTNLEYGQALAAHPSYTRGTVRAMWSSSIGFRRTTWSTRLGVDQASNRTPLGLWPVASGDLSWTVPLRAHARTSNDLLQGATTGRRMFHGGLSGDQPIYRAGPFTLAAGLFLDGVAVMSPADGSRRDRLYLDAGGGLRIGVLDGHLGTLRVDLATGLTDRRTAISMGIHQSWPPFRELAR
ncbi:MAG: C39 family peptidase [Gemmatimonadales bacterium]